MNTSQPSSSLFLLLPTSFPFCPPTPLLPSSFLPSSLHSSLSDRFRTVVNVLGDVVGVGIVHHYAQKSVDPALQGVGTDREALISPEEDAPPPGHDLSESKHNVHGSDSSAKKQVPTIDMEHLTLSETQRDVVDTTKDATRS